MITTFEISSFFNKASCLSEFAAGEKEQRERANERWRERQGGREGEGEKARKREGDSILLNSYNSHKYYLPMVKFKLKEFESWFKVKRSHNISGKMCCLLIADWVSLFRVKIVR